MSEEKIKKMIQTYGEDANRWPSASPKPEDFIPPEIQSELEIERRLGELLNLYTVEDADLGLINRIVARSAADEKKAGFFAFLLNPSLAFALIALFLVFGFVAGFYDGFTREVISQQIDPATALLGPVEDIGVI